MSSSRPAAKFQDHYSVLGVDRKASSGEIHAAYSALAAKFHPRNAATRDQVRYEAVTLAYEMLSDPAAREAFDSMLPKENKVEEAHFGGAAFFSSLQSETARRSTILSVLYDRRRQNPAVPGLSLRNMEAMIAFSSDELLFALWYLKQRGLVVADDKSNLLITADGMDYLERNQPDPQQILAMVKPAALSPAA